MATVSGYVEKIKYRNEENGYSILSVNSDGLDYVLVGTFPYISEGDFIEASGRDVEHPIYGDQIQVESYELKAPGRYGIHGALSGIRRDPWCWYSIGCPHCAAVQGRYLPHH